jgi:hypothetical protein
MTEEEQLSPRGNVELLIQARDALDTALQQAIAILPEDERAEFADQDVEGFSFHRFRRPGMVQIGIPSPGSEVSLNPQPIPPGAAWVSLNPQPLPPKYLTSGIIIVGG